jgi:HlyD family secretion protein
MRMFISVVVVIGLLGAGGWWFWKYDTAPKPEFRLAKVERGDLYSTIEATGTLEPQESVDVGAQVDGRIVSFGRDLGGKPIDYRSAIEANTVLATIDDAVYKADLNTARAQLDQAKSTLQKGQADVAQAEAKLLQAEQNWGRAQKLGPSDALSESDYDMYRAEFEIAKANVGVAQAEVTEADASIAAAQAALDKAQRNLDFCVIRSPVKGVIIDRRVNIGQTVVSSLNAPSLFLIANDLTRMQLWVAVNEADIQHVLPGQKVNFTTDDLPGEKFHGIVNKVRLNASMSQNVVTYTVEVDADNPENHLLPYMTANVQFEVHRDENVLMVPNSALRWYPSSVAEVTPDSRGQYKPSDQGDEDATPSAPDEAPRVKSEKGAKPRERHGTIWARAGEFVRPIAVKLGSTDNLNTEVLADELQPGEEVVVGEILPSESSGDDRDPFIPQKNRR